MVKQSPSLANINLLDMGETIRELYDAGIRMLHIDLMDGHYVPSLCLPPSIVKDIRRDYADMVLDVHMMVTNPDFYIGQLTEYGADYISFHADSTNFARKLCNQIHSAGKKAGIVINPSQRLDVIEPYAAYLDLVTLMMVEPGISGQRALPGGAERVAELADLRRRLGASFEISLDGGMEYGIMETCIENGADIIVTGNYAIFKQPDGIGGAAQRFQTMAAQVKRKTE